jgi:hypothetical protein
LLQASMWLRHDHMWKPIPKIKDSIFTLIFSHPIIFIFFLNDIITYRISLLNAIGSLFMHEIQIYVHGMVAINDVKTNDDVQCHVIDWQFSFIS